MRPLDRQAANNFVNTEIVYFHEKRLGRLEAIDLNEVLKKKNPYLFKAKNITNAGGLISGILGAFLSSSEEKLFGDFLEQLAIFISSQTNGGKKSSAKGVDLEFDRENTRYIVSIKSGPNWGNSSQYASLRESLRKAVVRQKQGTSLAIQPILGICYGKVRKRDTGLYIKLVGQQFWHFLSGDPDFYIDIIEPIGHRAKQHNEDFEEKRSAIENRFTHEFIEQFCHEDGTIDWPKLVEFNSGNLRGS